MADSSTDRDGEQDPRCQDAVVASDHEPVRREHDVITEDTTGKQVRSHKVT